MLLSVWNSRQVAWALAHDIHEAVGSHVHWNLQVHMNTGGNRGGPVLQKIVESGQNTLASAFLLLNDIIRRWHTFCEGHSNYFGCGGSYGLCCNSILVLEGKAD